MSAPFWIDIEVEIVGGQLRVTARGSRGEVTSPCSIPMESDRLDRFAQNVGRAVRYGVALDERTLREAQVLYTTLFDGEFRDLHVRLTEAAQREGEVVLHRLLLRNRELQSVPWEALCEPASTVGFWSTSPSSWLARGVPCPDPWRPREVKGPVRLLVVAPSFDNATLQGLRHALAGPIEAHEIEWLEPLVGLRASASHVFDALRQSNRPHILHYIGHGSLDNHGHPVLRLSNNEEEQEWVRVELLARELAANFAEDLALVILEACDGARPGFLGSAAEIISRAGIHAVIAHMWPVRADVASLCSHGLYKSLTAMNARRGNVASSLADVRRSLLLRGAEAFSPILYLRGTTVNIFDFQERIPSPPDIIPVSHVSSTMGQGTISTSGEPMPVWRTSLSIRGRLRFEVHHEDGAVSIVDKPLLEPRTHYIGRKEQRSDKKTANDFVLPSGRVSQDAASIEWVNGQFWIRNTSDKPRLVVNMVPIQPGDSRPLYHGSTVVVSTVSGVFSDGRYFHGAPINAVDPQTGLLSRDGLMCEVGVALDVRKPRVLLMFQFAQHDVRSASVAAQALHTAEPLVPIGRIDAAVGMLVETQSNLASRLELVRRAGVSPRAAGFLELTGSSSQAAVRVEAVVGALARIAAAGGTNEPVDLARYALGVVRLDDLAQSARVARAAGGGVGLLLLDELERYGALGEASRAAIELELREQLGGLLGPDDRIVSVGPGALAVSTRQPVDRLLRDIAMAWRARGPILVGALELDRDLRVLVLDEPTTAQLMANSATFLRDVSGGTNAHALPMPIAYWMSIAHRAGTTADRASALVWMVEVTWRFLGCVLVATFWSMRKGHALRLGALTSTWRSVTVEAAESLRTVDGRVGELASAIYKACLPDVGAFSTASKRADSLASMLAASFRDERLLEQETRALELAMHEAFAVMRALQGWSLVAVRQVEPLDTTETARVVDYVDFTGPYVMGTPHRHTVCGMRIAEFVYLVRWAEGLAIPLEPLVRRVRATGFNADGLAIIDNIPTAPGLHRFNAVGWDGRLDLPVTARQLTR